MASEISLLRSICSLIESIVWSTLSTFLLAPIMRQRQSVPDEAKVNVQALVYASQCIRSLLHRHHCLRIQVGRLQRVDLDEMDWFQVLYKAIGRAAD